LGFGWFGWSFISGWPLLTARALSHASSPQPPPPQNKPTRLADGARLVVGPAAAAFTVRVAPPPAAAARPTPPAGGPAEVRASHLLVKHARSRRPASWKEDPVTRSPEEALAMVEAFRAQLVESSGGGDNADLAARFAALAAVESHCSSARKGGDLGAFGRGAMQRAFEEPAFALAVGELSGPVSSDSGWHLILRTG
jgi:NIMA-interacting peptidyl-prolyl cis-trans isomerase 1